MIAVATAADIGGRRRFIAPPRDAVDAACFAQLIYAGLSDVQDLMVAPDWPTIAALDARLALPDKQLAEQNETLLADGLQYETRIAERGQIATRADNWHDLFNALIWARYPAIKRALNRQQCRHIAAMASGQRNRAQAALTQFDESGVIVRVRETTLLHAWDRHDWSALFVDGAGQWQHGDIAVSAVIGHALLEQALVPERLLVGKCVVVKGDDDASAMAAVAQAITDGALLNDPLELRPLPLAGIPGWHVQQDAALYARADYFRPLREGRVYPAALG
ncbi:DUF3025 domain-containing protein [Stenotrophomonas sp. TWI587]|uniref:DUF3025 domain-containing protein n=1 Tax=unclassified Stenotrophomonas TaxID=196198 RepID=UPI00320BADF3